MSYKMTSYKQKKENWERGGYRLIPLILHPVSSLTTQLSQWLNAHSYPLYLPEHQDFESYDPHQEWHNANPSPAGPPDAALYRHMMSPGYTQGSSSDVLTTLFSLQDTHFAHSENHFKTILSICFRSEFYSDVTINFHNTHHGTPTQLHELKGREVHENLILSGGPEIPSYRSKRLTTKVSPPTTILHHLNPVHYSQSTSVTSFHICQNLSSLPMNKTFKCSTVVIWTPPYLLLPIIQNKTLLMEQEKALIKNCLEVHTIESRKITSFKT